MLSLVTLYTTLVLAINYHSTMAQVNGTTATASLTSGLSTGCQTAAGALLSTDFSTCANVIGLVSVIGAQNSVLDPLNNWISGVCSSNPCSNTTLSSASSSVSAGCSGDVQKGVASAIALNTVITNYNAIRNLICTQYASNSTFCVPFVLGEIQKATGKSISVMEAQALITGGMTQLATSLPAGTYCNDCGHAILTQSAAISVNTGSTNASTTSTGASSSLSQTCGASFADGKLPSSIKIAGAGSSAGGAKNGASSQERVSLFNMAFVGLVGLIGICIV